MNTRWKAPVTLVDCPCGCARKIPRTRAEVGIQLMEVRFELRHLVEVADELHRRIDRFGAAVEDMGRASDQAAQDLIRIGEGRLARMRQAISDGRRYERHCTSYMHGEEWNGPTGAELGAWLYLNRRL